MSKKGKMLYLQMGRTVRAELASATLRLDAAAAVQTELETRAAELCGQLEASEAARALAEEDHKTKADAALQAPPLFRSSALSLCIRLLH